MHINWVYSFWTWAIQNLSPSQFLADIPLETNSNSSFLLSQFLWYTSLTFQKVQRISRKSADASALSQVLFIFACYSTKLFQVRAAIWSEKVGAEDTVFTQHMLQGILIWRGKDPWTKTTIGHVTTFGKSLPA